MSFCTSQRTQFLQPSLKCALPSILPKAAAPVLLPATCTSCTGGGTDRSKYSIRTNIPYIGVRTMVYSLWCLLAVGNGLCARGKPPSISSAAHRHVIMDSVSALGRRCEQKGHLYSLAQTRAQQQRESKLLFLGVRGFLSRWCLPEAKARQAQWVLRISSAAPPHQFWLFMDQLIRSKPIGVKLGGLTRL